jgi:hypothetical protein
MKINSIIFLVLTVAFSVLTNVVGVFIFPLVASIAGLFFSFSFQSPHQKEVVEIKNRLEDFEKNLHNIKLSLKLQKSGTKFQ